MEPILNDFGAKWIEFLNDFKDDLSKQYIPMTSRIFTFCSSSKEISCGQDSLQYVLRYFVDFVNSYSSNFILYWDGNCLYYTPGGDSNTYEQFKVNIVIIYNK